MLSFVSRFSRNRAVAVLGFVLAHLFLVWEGLKNRAAPMGDIIYAYQPWAKQMFIDHQWLGISAHWVYPFPNLLFVLVPSFLNPNYQDGWLLLSGSIELGALLVLLFWPRKYDGARVLAAWMWISAQLLLGPVSISRLDTISVAIAIIGLVAWLRAKPPVAAVIFAVATWIKVWPVTLLVAVVAEAKNWRKSLIWGAGIGMAILALGLLLSGSGAYVFSFITEQSDRGIQIESPWATYWLWQGVRHVFGSGIYYSQDLITFQVAGPGTMNVAHLLGPVMYGALAITMFLGWRAIRGSAAIGNEFRNEVFAWTALTAVLDLIVFNKVGSPQYYTWLIVPAILGSIERVPGWKVVNGWLAAIFGLTGLIYPIIYDEILKAEAWATAYLTARNVLVVLLLVLANWRLVELNMRNKPMIAELAE